MAQIFPERSNQLALVLGLGLPLGLVAAVAFVWYYFSPWYTQVGYQPTQPVPYSHRLHAGDLEINCRYCHARVDVSPVAGVPPTQVCMNCHRLAKKDSPLLQPIRDSAASGFPVRWVRVHELPDYAYFNHAAHVHAGVGCVDLPRSHRPDGGGPPGEAAQHGLVSRLSPRPRPAAATGRRGDEHALGPTPGSGAVGAGDDRGAAHRASGRLLGVSPMSGSENGGTGRVPTSWPRAPRSTWARRVPGGRGRGAGRHHPADDVAAGRRLALAGGARRLPPPGRVHRALRERARGRHSRDPAAVCDDDAVRHQRARRAGREPRGAADEDRRQRAAPGEPRCGERLGAGRGLWALRSRPRACP